MNYKEFYKDYFSVEKLEKECAGHTKRYEAMIDMIVGKTVLDCGAGTGTFARLLKEKGYEVTAFDIKENYVEFMKKNDVNAIFGDIEKIPFGDNSFDTVIAGEILEHMENPGIALSECFRVAKEAVVFSLPESRKDPPWHLWINQFQKVDGWMLTSFTKYKDP